MNKLDEYSWNQAWMTAESLAWGNRHTHAVVYKRQHGSRVSFEARLATDNIDSSLKIATTVSRKPLPNGDDEGSCKRLVEALAYVILNIPHNTTIAPLVKVEYSPNGEIWSHSFLSTNQEEIATWYKSSIEFYPGVSGCGRPIGISRSDKIIRIDSLITEARSLLDE